MDLIFLGTSSGVPTKNRNVTAIALRESQGGRWYLIDCGEATQHQILHTTLSVNALEAIFITHVHGDHCYGLPGLIASAAMHGRREPLKIIAPSGVQEWFAATQQHTQLHLPFELEFICSDPLPQLSFPHLRVEICKLSHRVPSYAYTFIETKREARLDTEKLIQAGVPRGPLWGLLQKGEDIEHAEQKHHSADYLSYPHSPRKIVIAGDNDDPELLSQSCQDCQVLVHEATYTSDSVARTGTSYGHSDAERVARFAAAAGIPNLVLTHFSPRYQDDPNRSPCITDIRDEAEKYYRGGLYLARDFACFQLDKTGRLWQVESVGDGGMPLAQRHRPAL